MYLYIKALHIIFVITWFAGLFYVVRLFIYNREAQDKQETERSILQYQFGIMIRRLWYVITWPSCILTIIFGLWMLYLYESLPQWLIVKIILVVFLLGYHLTLHIIFHQQTKGVFGYTSKQLRIWNEVATIFLVTIVFLVVLKSLLSWLWTVVGFLTVAFMISVIVIAIRRCKNS